jgi:Glycogen debranching enzyme
MLYKGLILLLFIATVNPSLSQWHGKERSLHYTPKGADFVTVNGKLRFNRALYGTHTGFRVEAGDLPEFALYLPGMGGSFRLGLMAGNKSKWLIDAKNIKAIYRPGSMLYEIKDPLLGNGTMHITVLPMANAEGMIIKTQFINVTAKTSLVWAYGGATGKKFNRDGDIGADPESSFYLQPEYCTNNSYTINGKTFQLKFGNKQLCGIVPSASDIAIKDAALQETPLSFYNSSASATPAIGGKMAITNSTSYFSVQHTDSLAPHLPKLFAQAEDARKKLAGRIKLVTPDVYLNTLGAALSVAADAIWESPTYLHGAVAWRMRLPAWRGAYVADVLGWHDRARTHFSSYALSQVKEPATGPVVFDTARNLARQLEKMGTSMFSSGYICRNPNGDIRPHHYDMNLVFIDQLLTHFYYTGDTAYIKEMWPLIQRHLAWEKRNFDTDNDGLYDAYCCIWASDALQYSGGAVTHSSAYNYRAHAAAAELAAIIGEDPTPYKQEATKIFEAINNHLWMPELGWYAEYRDALGKQMLHPAAGLWTIYHAIDSKVPDAFRAYQSLRYIDKHIPHIPVRAKGLKDTGFYLLSTTNWQPYTWSVNNVALAENLHAALAYWQGNRSEKAFHLWKSALVESMYLGASPGNFQQLSFYDAMRGELYRDFADPVGMAGRTLIEGLFGIRPNAFTDTLTIQPGLPAHWKNAFLQTPDISFDFKRTTTGDQYVIKPAYRTKMNLRLICKAWRDDVESVTVNGQPSSWRALNDAVGDPLLELTAPEAQQYTIVIKWRGIPIEPMRYDNVNAAGAQLTAHTPAGFIQSIYDPQQLLQNIMLTSNQLQATIQNATGHKTAFIQLRQGAFVWWFPVCVEVKPPVEIISTGLNTIRLKNNGAGWRGKLIVNGISVPVDSNEISVNHLLRGTNRFRYEWGTDQFIDTLITNWQIPARPLPFETVDLSSYFNDKVTAIFKQAYLSPRPQSPTLQLPTQGIGNWCYPLVQAEINDSGLRQAAGAKNRILLPQQIPFATPGDTLSKNIIFTSQWDNYPDSAVVPLQGKATHVYCMLAGSTNPMQSRVVNGVIRVRYADGSLDSLALRNPQNWWPIEQDLYEDGYAFSTGAPKPLRYYLKTGSTIPPAYITIKGFTNMGIEGGAATILDLPLDPAKELQSISLHSVANDVVIGLMGVTLVRDR